MEELNPTPIAEDEIDLLAIAKTLWSGRKTILLSILIGSILGITVALLTPNVYTAKTVLVSQMGNSSQYSGLASLAGINFGTPQSGELSTNLYPMFMKSIPFKLELMNTLVKFSKIEKPISLFDYYTKYKKPSTLETIKSYTIGLPQRLIEIVITIFKKKPTEIAYPKSQNINNERKLVQLTNEQNWVKGELDGIVSLNVDQKQGILTLSVNMSEASAAAQIVQKTQELLQREITRLKSEKAQSDLDFIQERYNIAKSEAERYQVNVAVNTDRFKNLTSTLPNVQTSFIQTKSAISTTIFTDLARQLEQGKIQVKKETPVFTVIEPVSVPLTPSEPNREKIIIIWIFLGGIIGVGILFGKQYYAKIKEKWND